jgi:deoxyribonuclease V
MIVAIDVHYREKFAKSISIEFDNWQAETPSKINEVFIKEVYEYIPGEFYKRELPCIVEVLKKSSKEEIELIIVDGYVTLDDSGKFGLGAYLYKELRKKIPIIGVAKRRFANNIKNVIEIQRGKSKNPIFVTSVGIDLIEASQKIKNMKGDFRMPDLLRILDQKTKEK